MRLRRGVLGLAVLVWSGTAIAQSGGVAASNPLPPSAPALPATIRNAPFSAEVVTQYDRVLANSNHIHRETHGKVFRDNQGRVRTETEFPSAAGGVDKTQSVTIQDPLQRVVIHLDPRNKTALVHHLGDANSAAIGGTQSRPGNVLLMAPQPGQGSTASTIPLQHSDPARKPVTQTEPLGMKSIEGVQATGTKTTRTFESSDAPAIVSVSEVWYSRELQTVVLSETDDGQSGKSMMKLENVVRAEPNPQLFQVPADYTVKDTNPATASVKH